MIARPVRKRYIKSGDDVMNDNEMFLSRCDELITSYDRPESLPDTCYRGDALEWQYRRFMSLGTKVNIKELENRRQGDKVKRAIKIAKELGIIYGE